MQKEVGKTLKEEVARAGSFSAPRGARRVANAGRASGKCAGGNRTRDGAG